MRLLVAAAAVLLMQCGPAPPVTKPVKPDPTNEAWYGQTTEELRELNRKAEALFRAGNSEGAGALVTAGLPLMNRLVSVPHPTLAATEAASDLDDLYARILLKKRQYGWARLQFQKNVARWQHWRPQTEETARRRKIAVDGIALCDRHIAARPLE